MQKFNDEVKMFFPRFVMHRKYGNDKQLNDELIALSRKYASNDATKNANFLKLYKDNASVQKLVSMAKDALKSYLKQVHDYEGFSDISMSAKPAIYKNFIKTIHGEVFTQRMATYTHNHTDSHFVITYYLKNDRSSSQQGLIRFYDPTFGLNRPFKTKNPQLNDDTFEAIEPEVGSMIVFDGMIAHDGSYFDGEERICIPIKVRLQIQDTPFNISANEYFPE